MHVHLPATNLLSTNRFASITKDYKKFILIIYSLAAGSGLEAFNLYSNLRSSCIIQQKAERKYVSGNISALFVHLWIFSFVINSLTTAKTSTNDVTHAPTQIKPAGDAQHSCFTAVRADEHRMMFEWERKWEEKSVFSLHFSKTHTFKSRRTSYANVEKQTVRFKQ